MRRFVLVFSILAGMAITTASIRISSAAEPEIVPDDPLVTSFMQSDVWWALKSQRDMAADQRISNVMNLGTHNSFNASAEGFERQLFFSVAIQPNQLFSIKDQLRMGVRLIELDVYDVDIDGDDIKDMVLMHRDTVGKTWMSFEYALTEIKDWLTAPGHETEIIFLDIEDGASGNLALLNEIKSYFVSGYSANGQCDGLISTGLIFTPEDRKNCFSGRWPSRNELLSLGKRIIIFNHKDLSDGNYRVFVAYSIEDEYQYVWRGSDWFFSTGSTNDSSQSFSDNQINDYWTGNELPANVYEPHLGYQQDKSRFFAVRGDGAVGASPRAMVGWDVAYCATNNVNFIKMDFALGQEYDIEDKPGTGFNDFDAPGGRDNDFEMYSFLDNIRGSRLSRAVWSWQIDTYRHNPNIYFLSYQQLHSPTARDQNRTDGRHYAVQDGFLYSPSISPFQLILSQDWTGVATDSTNTYFRTTRGHWNTQQKNNLHPFACAKIGSNGTEWQITQQAGTWDEGAQICREEFYSEDQAAWAFAGPVNGWQNSWLLLTRWNYAYSQGRTSVATSPVWINVSDEDNDAYWTVRTSDENFPPIADAGPDQAVSAGPNCTAAVTLDGSASYDPNEDPLTYRWSWDGNVVIGASPTAQLPLGTTTITLVVFDGTEDSASDTVDISVSDNTHPEMTLSATPQVLWPPNHRMVPVTIEGPVSDNCDDASSCEIIAVDSNEPVDGIGYGNTSPDWMITGDSIVDLRAERARSRTGRVYTIGIECADASNNSVVDTLEVYVPHDQRNVAGPKKR